jgi:hypothetical protein
MRGSDPREQSLDRGFDVDGRERTVGSGRGIDAHEGVGRVGRRVELGREGQSSAGQALGDRLGQAGFEDWRPAVVRGGDAGRIEVGDGDPVAEPREADRGDQADVAGTEQEEVHEVGSPVRCESGRLPER